MLFNESHLPFELPSDTPSQVVALTEEFWRQGFVRIGNIFSAQETTDLKSAVNSLIQGTQPWSKRWTDYGATEYFLPPFGDNDWVVLSNIAGRSPQLDQLLEHLFVHPVIRSLLEITMGKGYKAWELSVRRSNSKDKGLGLHEDGRGELGISVLLQDHTTHSGTTSLIPGSHRYSVGCRDAGAEDYVRPSFMRWFTVPATGKAGDVFFFFKKTWHGRIKSDLAVSSDALIFGLFPVGYEFRPYDLPESARDQLPPELKRLLRTDRDFAPSANNLSRVIGPESSNRLMDYVYDGRHSINTYWRFALPMKKVLDFARDMRNLVLRPPHH